MKPRRTHTRKPAVVTDSRWLAYATAGAASAFIGANSAEATIHYSGPINQTFVGDEHATFRLDPRGGALFLKHVQYTYESILAGGSALVNIFAPSGASVAGGFFTCPYTQPASVSNLSRGRAISARPFVPDGGLLGGIKAYHYDCGWGPRGQFQGLGTIGFVGFRFNNGSGDQYGWARVQMQLTRNHYPRNTFKLIDYGWGDVGDRVRAGQKSGGYAPELESLGGLALGAAGLIGWRKRRARAQTQRS